MRYEDIQCSSQENKSHIILTIFEFCHKITLESIKNTSLPNFCYHPFLASRSNRQTLVVRTELGVGLHCVALPPPAPFNAHRYLTKTHLHIIHVYLQPLLSTAKQLLMTVQSVVNHMLVCVDTIYSVCFNIASSYFFSIKQKLVSFFFNRKNVLL